MGADVGMGVGVRAHVCDMMIVIVYTESYDAIVKALRHSS